MIEKRLEVRLLAGRVDPQERRRRDALADGVTRAWGSSDGWRMPESVVADDRRGVAYVSNMNPTGPGFGDGGFISKVTLDGTVEALQWVTGLRGPTGLALAGDRLLVVERTGLAVIDVANAEVAERWAFDGAVFLNDVAVAEDGVVYVTDSNGGVVYEVKDGWEPLCAFLGKRVPDTPFPKTNNRQEYWELARMVTG